LYDRKYLKINSSISGANIPIAIITPTGDSNNKSG